jgi:hypothetical protein
MHRAAFDRPQLVRTDVPHLFYLALRFALLVVVMVAAPPLVTSASPAIALVQHTSKDAGTTNSSTVAFPSNNAAGNWIGVCIRAGAVNETFTVTDSGGNTYRKAIQFNETADGNSFGIYYAENIAGGANRVTVSDTAVATLRIAILEYSGVATSGSLDVFVATQGDSSTPNSGVTAMTTTNGELLLGAIMTGNPATFAAGGGYTVEESVPAEPGTKLIAEDQIQVTAGASTASATLGATDFWAAGVAAFKAATGVVGTSPSITSGSNTTFTVGAAGAFTVTTTGTPTPSLTETGALPSGVTFKDNGNGTATLSGTPASGMGGTYSITFTASNGIGTAASQKFTLVVGSAASVGFVQVNYATPQTPQTKVTVAYTQAQTAGDLNVVVVGWNDSTAQINSVTDSKSNAYVLGVGPTVQSGTATQAIYYGKNIAAAGANSNTVTVTFNTGATAPDIRIAEYSGIDPTTPVDVVAAAQGNGASSSSGSVNTVNANDLLVGANLVQQSTTGPGAGYTSRVITSPDGDILEDQIVNTAGSRSATAAVTGGAWIMQMVAFRVAGSGVGTSPSITSLSPTSGPQGAPVTITGTNFGSPQGTSTVKFNGTIATVATWGATSISTSVPTGATTGNVVVTVNGTASNGVNFAVPSLSVTLSPKRAAVTLFQSQQFTATVNNDPQNGGVSWSVDGINGGNTTSGTVSSTGLFTPGTQPGVHTVTATSNSNSSASASATVALTDLAGVFTYHNDAARTGQNLQEYALTTATVNSSTFGALFSCPVDGYVYATPLYIAKFNIGGQMRNVVFVATEHDSVYAFDADSSSCVQLWHTVFLSSGVTTVPPADTGETSDLVPEIGITSTPVIDPSTNTIYVVAKTKETVGSGCSSGNPCYFHRLHALDLTTGAEKFGGPVVLSAPNFVPLFHLQRPALLLNNGTVYIAFGSHGDANVYQGWLMAYNGTTLVQQWVWHSTDPTSGNNEGAIWGAGNGPALDASGNIYVETANGFFDGVNNFSDSVVKLSPAGVMLSFFTPFDQAVMQQNDIDLGSSGPIILPDAVGSATNPHLMIITGKVGVVYLLDQTNLGGYNPASNQDLGEVSVGFNLTGIGGGFFGQPAYWNGNIYTIIVGDSLRQYSISNGVVSTVSNANSSNTFTYRGATPAVSASGTSNGIVWVADVTAYKTSGAVVLDAFDATNVSSLLYSSPSSGTGAAATAAKFTVPTVANGKVYVGGQLAFTVFGLLPN